MDDALTARLQKILDEHVTDDVARIGLDRSTSAAHVLVVRDGHIAADLSAGHAALVPAHRPLQASPIFDLASVTKPLVGATLAWLAVDRGLLDLDAPLEALIPGWDRAPDHLPGATLAHLLNHTSGLAAWRKFYEEWPIEPPVSDLPAQRAAILDAALLHPRAYAPGHAHAYSDLGFMLLGDLLSRTFNAPLDLLARQHIFDPLHMTSARYVSRINKDLPIQEAVATEYCTHRGRIVVGEVHDENTMCMGGVSAHAGVFSTARDLATFGQHLLEIDQGAGGVSRGIVSQEILRWAWSEDAGSPHGSHRGGWDTPSGARSSAGSVLSHPHTVGHLGFTGTSLWIDRQSATVVVLLSNRVHPSRDNPRAHALRVAIHDAL
jgi:CubicO group peptidase (beta-lactamase class C family)